MNQKITVFYDGKCGICSKEIKHYQKIAPKGVFDWQDITQLPQALTKNGISLYDGFKQLHVKDAKGNIHKGIDSFIVIWRQMKWWKIFAAFVSLPLVKQVFEFGYKLFANWRFKRLAHCQVVAKSENR